MVIGTAITVVALLMLGFTKEFVGLFVGGEEAVKRPTIVLAVLSIYVVDFAINASKFACSLPNPYPLPYPSVLCI